MNSNITKTLITITAILIFVISAVGIYKYFASKTAVPTSSEGESTTNVFPESDKVISLDSADSSQVDGRETQTSPTRTNQTDNLDVKIVSERPVAGAVFEERQEFQSKNKKLYAKYMERESGHVFLLADNANLPQKISNTTVTRVYQSFFNNTGTDILIRRLDENNNVQNISAVIETKAKATSTDVFTEDMIGKLNQSLLSANIKEVVVSPDKDKIFYLTEVGGDFIGTVEDFGKQKSPSIKRQVFGSPLGEWQIEWPANNTMFFNTKPSINVPGFLFSQSLNKNSFTKILGGVNGLASKVSPGLKKFVYSESVSDGVQTYIYDLIKKERALLPLKTLPEKCVWGGIEKEVLYCAVPKELPKGDYPDSWYQGLVSFDDELWMVDTKTGSSLLLADKSALGRNEGIDAIDLSLSPSEEYLLLTNKKDSSLWQVRLK